MDTSSDTNDEDSDYIDEATAVVECAVVERISEHAAHCETKIGRSSTSKTTF